MKQFAICLGVVVILLLNVIEVFSVCGGAPLDRPCCVCDPNVHLDVSSKGLVCVCWKFYPHLGV